MTVLVDDPYDARFARGATGVLAAFNAAGVLEPADVHVAVRISRLGGETADDVVLALALAVRGVRLGSVCVDLRAVKGTVLGAEPIEIHCARGVGAGRQFGADHLLLPPVALEVEQPVDQPQRPPVRRLRAVGDERARGTRRSPGRRRRPG